VIDPDLIGYTVDIPGQANYLPHLVTGFSARQASRMATIVNPMCGGISISNALVYAAGTLGGFVQERGDPGKVMILSNWHVLDSLWAGWQNIAIYQPGQLDGGYAYHTVAYLTRHAMDQNLDAAVATLSGGRNITNQQRGLGSVTGITTPLLGMHVVKSGRTTGVTKGIIDGIGGRRMFNYGGISRMVREHIHIIPAPDGTPTVSSPGDSGAWWLEENTHRAIGLHFGGNDYPEYALAFAMPPVLEALNVDLVL
jgi:endonuclease G